MPTTTYATNDDVAQELAALFPNGFGATTQPAADDVDAKLTEITTVLRARVVFRLGAEPQAGDDGAVLIKRGVVAKVAAWVLRRAAIGYAMVDVQAMTQPYEDTYREVVETIDRLSALVQAGPTPTAHRVGATASANVRDPVQPDDAIGRTDLY